MRVRAKKISRCTKNGLFFLQLTAEKKAPFWGAARKFFGPSYFVTALAQACLVADFSGTRLNVRATKTFGNIETANAIFWIYLSCTA